MISGEILKTILKVIKKGDQQKIKDFPLTRLLEIFLAICDAMSYACSPNVIYRDFKPSTIIELDISQNSTRVVRPLKKNSLATLSMNNTHVVSLAPLDTAN